MADAFDAVRRRSVQRTVDRNDRTGSGSFGFEAYDFFITNILKGPFGAIAGVLAIIAGVVVMIQQKLVPAVLCILGGVLVINSDKIVTSLGMII